MVTHGTNWRSSRAKCSSSAQILWSVVSWRCDFFLSQFDSGSLNINWHLVLDPTFYCKKYTELVCTPRSFPRACDDCLARISTGFHSPSSISLHHRTSLKDVLTLEHWVLAGDEFAHHSESEFVPSTVCKLVGKLFFFVLPGLFRLSTNTNNQV